MACMFVPGWLVGTAEIIGYIILIAIITIITVAVGMRRNIRNNWDKYRCNPVILPFAGFFGYDPTKTFTECLSKNVNETTGPVVKPYGDLFDVMKSTAGNMTDSLGDMQGVMSSLRDNIMSGIESVLKKVANMGATAKFMMTKVQAIFSKVLALYVTLLYFAWSMVKGLEAIVRDPALGQIFGAIDSSVGILTKKPDLGKFGKSIGKSAKKTGKKIKKGFCFAADTPVVMYGGSIKAMKDVNIGDLLMGGHRVTGKMMFDGQDTPLVHNNGIVCTETHHMLFNGKYRRAREVPGSVPLHATVDYLYDLDTSDHKIVCLNNKNKFVTFTDFTEVDDHHDVVEAYELALLNKTLSKPRTSLVNLA